MAAKKTLPAKTSNKNQPSAKGPSKTAKPAAKLVKGSTPGKVTKAAKTTKAPATTKSAKPAAPPKPVKAKRTALTEPAKEATAAKRDKAAKTNEPRTNTSLLDAGSAAPRFELSDASGTGVSSDSLAGKPYLLYFYPKDDTPGCTKEACDIRDNFGRFGKLGLKVLGVSPDSQQSHAKFGKKYGLPFTLLSDPDKTLASAYGVWGEKNNYGKKYMGIIRSSFLVGADGVVRKAYRGVKVNGHVDAVLEDARELL